MDKKSSRIYIVYYSETREYDYYHIGMSNQEDYFQGARYKPYLIARLYTSDGNDAEDVLDKYLENMEFGDETKKIHAYGKHARKVIDTIFAKDRDELRNPMKYILGIFTHQGLREHFSQIDIAAAMGAFDLRTCA